MSDWIREHKETISILLVVLAGVLLGVVVGGIFAFLSGFWFVASGTMADMVLTSWGY